MPKIPPAFNPFYGKLEDIPAALKACQELKGCTARGICYMLVSARTLILSAAGLLALVGFIVYHLGK